MERKLVIDGNMVYELDEECMLKKKQCENTHSFGPTLSDYVNHKAEQKAKERQNDHC